MLVNRKNLRSKGCHTCISRKIKCDETKPHCLRCTRSKRQCPGYRDWADLNIRASHSIVQTPTASDTWRTEAIPLFLAAFTSHGINGQPGHYDFLHEFLQESLSEFSAPSPSSAFVDATWATAMAYFARRSNDRALIIEAGDLYGKALASLKADLEHPETVKKDSTLAAVMLLARREIILGRNYLGTGPHDLAQGPLLQLHAIETMTPRCLQMASSIILNRSIRRLCHGAPAGPRLDGRIVQQAMLHNDFCDFLFAADDASGGLRTAMLEHEANFNPTDDEAHDGVETALLRVLALCERMASFHERAPKIKCYRLVPFHDPRPRPGFRLQHAFVFHHLQYVTCWTTLWASHLCVLEALREAMQRGYVYEGHPLYATVLRCVEQDVGLAYNICASVPFALEEIDAKGVPTRNPKAALGPRPLMMASWLYKAGAVRGVSVAQRTWIADRLNQIGHERYVGQLFTVRDVLLRRNGMTVEDL